MALYNPIHARFERFCKARTFGHGPHEDLMHDSLLVAFEKFDDLKDKDAFCSFLFGICRRICANLYRKQNESSWLDAYDQMQAVESQGEKNLVRDDLYKALDQLPEEQGEALILFEIAGFSIRETAKIQETSEDAVKQRLHRGRKMLVRLLSDEPKLSLQEK
ncbi:MAG: RNA polymerase sigma factor [Crocinitomicaceae bacterium]|nr:RNA polymerase sigma factor [Crocinitomicaceae bacterium]